ncbi:MAG TPA: hypothetical protein VF605_09885 [Allosphingosinicella sp.]|jgi:hypothetical protein
MPEVGCLCGNVRYRVSGEAVARTLCHFASHRLPRLPHAEALADPPLLKRVLGIGGIGSCRIGSEGRRLRFRWSDRFHLSLGHG